MGEWDEGGQRGNEGDKGGPRENEGGAKVDEGGAEVDEGGTRGCEGGRRGRRGATLSTTVSELYSFMKCFGTCQFVGGLWMDISGKQHHFT